MRRTIIIIAILVGVVIGVWIGLTEYRIQKQAEAYEELVQGFIDLSLSHHYLLMGIAAERGLLDDFGESRISPDTIIIDSVMIHLEDIGT